MAQLETITAAMPERYRAMILLASWCALRFGELAELRRGDVNTRTGVIRVRRGVVRASGQTIVKSPKSQAGTRDVVIPPHIVPAMREHLFAHAEPGKDGLLFPAKSGGHLRPSTLYRVWYPAREAAGRPDLRFHDLRGTGAVMAAQTGATMPEVMARLGHNDGRCAPIPEHRRRTRRRDRAAACPRWRPGKFNDESARIDRKRAAPGVPGDRARHGVRTRSTCAGHLHGQRHARAQDAR